MSLRLWLWLGTVLNAIIVLPAVFMAFSAIGFAFTYPQATASFVAFLFAALPVFCVVASFAAWRLHRKRPRDLNAAFTVAAPIVYAAFLVVLLLWN
jgi:hypothetical protein